MTSGVWAWLKREDRTSEAQPIGGDAGFPSQPDGRSYKPNLQAAADAILDEDNTPNVTALTHTRSNTHIHSARRGARRISVSVIAKATPHRIFGRVVLFDQR